MIERPFRELHELYKLLYESALAQQELDEKRKKDEEEAAKRQSKRSTPYRPPSDVKKEATPELSPLEAEALEDAFEEMM